MQANPAKICIYGRSGMGKSCLMNRLVRSHRRVILFDHIEERSTEAQKEGFQEVTCLKELQDLIEKNYRKGFRYWYHPNFREGLVKRLSELSDLLLHIQEEYGKTLKEAGKSIKNRPSLMLAVDELKASAPNRALKDDEDMFSFMCSEGRHKGIHLVGATQRPAEITTKFRGQMEDYYIFNLQEPRDYDAIEALGGKKHGKELAEIVRELKPLEYIRMHSNVFTKGKITFS